MEHQETKQSYPSPTAASQTATNPFYGSGSADPTSPSPSGPAAVAPMASTNSNSGAVEGEGTGLSTPPSPEETSHMNLHDDMVINPDLQNSTTSSVEPNSIAGTTAPATTSAVDISLGAAMSAAAAAVAVQSLDTSHFEQSMVHLAQQASSHAEQAKQAKQAQRAERAQLELEQQAAAQQQHTELGHPAVQGQDQDQQQQHLQQPRQPNQPNQPHQQHQQQGQQGQQHTGVGGLQVAGPAQQALMIGTPTAQMAHMVELTGLPVVPGTPTTPMPGAGAMQLQITQGGKPRSKVSRACDECRRKKVGLSFASDVLSHSFAAPLPPFPFPVIFAHKKLGICQ